MARKIRKDCTIGTLEKMLGVTGVFRNKDGRKTRRDMQLGTLRKRSKKS